MRRRKSAAGGGAKTRGRKATRPTRGHAPARARRRSISATELQEQLDRRTRELNEALAQQAATSEENMRLLNELRQSLQQQTATAAARAFTPVFAGDVAPTTMLTRAHARPRRRAARTRVYPSSAL
jgi:hypothetical protein